MKKTRIQEFAFWLVVGALNFLLFVPAYVVHQSTCDFFPFSIFQEKSILAIGKALLYNRSNADIFRGSIEFSLLLFTFLCLVPPKGRKMAIGAIFVFYLILLFYQIYHQSFYALYQTPPFFYNDWGLLKVGWYIFLYELGAAKWGILFLVLLLGTLLFIAIRFLFRYFEKIHFSYFSYGIGLFFLLESMVFLFRWGYKSWPEHVLQFHMAAIVQNLKESRQARQQMDRVDLAGLAAHRPYDHLQWNRQPNFFFIFVESYGRVIYDDPVLSKDYQTYLPALEQQLRDSAWQVSSVLSRAPVSGGASWVSYSTFLDGFDFRNRGTFWALLRDTAFYNYQHLPRLLQSKGYRNYRLSAIGSSDEVPIPWESYTRFYAVDEWIKYADFNYRGLLYGWGPSPPDQFSLNFANAYIREKQGQQPFSLFFISQNSHNPFVSPDEVAPDWRLLNDSLVDQQTESRIFEQPDASNYAQSIRYQLSYLVDFIVKEGREEDVFVIVGDHQPPLFPQPGSGFETPFHLIGRDSAFIRSFQEQNFSPGLWIADTSKTIRHEGFYSLLLHHLYSHYGTSKKDIPPYLPNGLESFFPETN